MVPSNIVYNIRHELEKNSGDYRADHTPALDHRVGILTPDNGV